MFYLAIIVMAIMWTIMEMNGIYGLLYGKNGENRRCKDVEDELKREENDENINKEDVENNDNLESLEKVEDK